MRHSAILAIASGVGLALGLCASVGQAQPRSPVLIRQQIESSLNRQIQAVNALEAPEQARRLTWEAYVQMRAAHGNMTINDSNAKYPDPLFPLANQRIEQARAQVLSAHDALKTRTTWNASSNPIEVARKHLTEAIRMTRLILATTF
jgi:hypothetical protein